MLILSLMQPLVEGDRSQLTGISTASESAVSVTGQYPVANLRSAPLVKGLQPTGDESAATLSPSEMTSAVDAGGQ